MRDLKAARASKVKGNRRKKESRDWKRLFQRVLRAGVCLVSLVLIVSGGGLLAKLLFDSSYFKVEQVLVKNQQRVGIKEIVALSDIAVGNNIFELDLDRIGRKIEENPWVETARVQRQFPRTVLIEVEERSPRAVINLDYLYYVDSNAEIFKVLEAQDSLDFPVITGFDRKALLENAEQSRQKLLEMMALVDELGKRNLFGLSDVSEIHLDGSGEIVLYTRIGGIPVRMGQGAHAAKLDRLEKIYAELEPRLRGLKYIDLNVMDRIIVKVENGSTRKG